MTDEQNVAYVNSQVACAMIEAMGMQAENQFMAIHGCELPYRQDAFNAVSLKYGIHHNQVLPTLQGHP